MEYDVYIRFMTSISIKDRIVLFSAGVELFNFGLPRNFTALLIFIMACRTLRLNVKVVFICYHMSSYVIICQVQIAV